MKLKGIISSVLVVFLIAGCKETKSQEVLRDKGTFFYQNPIKSGIDENGLRDCQVFRDGKYWYMTGTS